jgi:hypothetical protein
MAHRFRNRVDIWFETRNEARHWGKRSSRLRHAPVVVEPELAWRPPSSPVDLPAAALFQPALSD